MAKIKIAPGIEDISFKEDGRTMQVDFSQLHLEYTIGAEKSDEWIKQNEQAMREGFRCAIALSSKTWQIAEGMNRWLECEGKLHVTTL